MKNQIKTWGLALAVLIVNLSTTLAHAQLNVNHLSDLDIARVKHLIERLTPLIQERQTKEDLSRMTFEELYDPLNAEERQFLKKFQNLDGKKLGIKIPFRGMAFGTEDLVVIKGQKVKINNQEKELPAQFLPRKVYVDYSKMMEEMRKDLGKRLYVESGYRSSAYQLYLFVYYLQNHEYSIKETVKWVTLPGYSEHGSVTHQAIDFISENGISGEENPQLFEDLEEYRWLEKNASRFSFVLSYPKNAGKGITYEPWHWRYEEKK